MLVEEAVGRLDMLAGKVGSRAERACVHCVAAEWHGRSQLLWLHARVPSHSADASKAC
jgi:hypothetical protein